MSDTARPKSGGDKLSANEINQDLPVVVTAGETINGDTLPVAVYMDDTDNEVKACDANDQAKLEFIGFAISDSTDGNSITLQKNGVVGGFSGLDVGKKYYVQDDKTIGTSMGTYECLVGIAISATQILIQKGSFEYIGSASVDTDGSTATAIPTGCTTILIKCFKAASGNATTGNKESGAQLTLKEKGMASVAVNITYQGASGGSSVIYFKHFRATWSGTSLTAKTFAQENAGTETEDSGYTITAYFYK
jgi:hypothetical protein